MSEPSAVETPATTSLNEHLQQVTEALASTTNQDDVLHLVLAPVLTALNAVAGAVLLVDATGQQLRLAATEGHEEQAQTIWQDGPLDENVPAGAALAQHHSLFFEHQGALVGAYPQLEERSGAVAPVATAVLPMFLDGRPLGSLIFDFKEPHTFTREERQFLHTLAAQTAVALGRARLSAQRAQEIDRFRRMVEVSPVGMAVGSLDGQLTLVNDAWLHLLGYTRQEFERGEIDWLTLTPETYWAQDQRAFETAFSQGVSTTYEKEMLTKEGELLPLEVTLIRHDANQVVGYSKDLRLQRAQAQVVATQAAMLEAEQEASRAFMTFTEAASHLEEIDQLGRLALETLQTVLPGSSGVFYTRDDTHWQPHVWTRDLSPELLSVLQRGLPLETPVFAELLQTGAPVFVDGWTEGVQGVAHTGQFQTVAVYPVAQQARICAVLSVALQSQPRWSEAQQATVRALGRSFSLLYDRIATARQLQVGKEEAEQRSRVLEAFASLSAELNVLQRPHELIRQAQEIVLSLLPQGHALYWEPIEGLWRVRAQTGDVGHPALQAAIEAGVPVGRLPTIDLPWQTGEPEYQAQYAAGRDLPFDWTRQAQSVVALPVFQGETLRGVMNFTLTEPHVWRVVDQVVLETVQQSLSLALDRLHQQQVVQQQRDEAENRARALEAFAVLSRDLVEETSRYALIYRAQETMMSLLTPGYALYWEEAGDRWELKSQVGDIGDPALQQLVDEHGLPLDAPALHSTWMTGVPNYQDNYDQGADTPAEMIRHVQAATAFRVEMQGKATGMLAIGLFDQRSWTPMDKAVLETAIYSLGLVLERAQSVAALAEKTGQLETANHELQAANEELEAFTYSASHDLRTPVRHVMGFAELAEKAMAQGQYEKVGRSLEVVKQGALRMTSLIDGMLVLSRSGRQELHVQPIDLSILVTQARRDAAAEFGSHPVNWQIGDLPTVQGDHNLLQQVMTNLLSNAVKYSAKKERSEVRVWCEESVSEWTIRVQDNGVGFDPQYEQRLFGIFQRLHTEKEFKGTGVGLATMRRIVLKHNGHVFAESDGLTGATFGFTLPRLR